MSTALEHIEGVETAPAALRRWLERHPEIAERIIGYYKESVPGGARHWVYVDFGYKFRFIEIRMSHTERTHGS